MRSPIFVATLLTTGVWSTIFLSTKAVCAQVVESPSLRAGMEIEEEDAIALSYSHSDINNSDQSTLSVLPVSMEAESAYIAAINHSLNADATYIASIDDILNATAIPEQSVTVLAEGVAIATIQGLPMAEPDPRLLLADARWDEFINAHTPDIDLRIQPRFSAGHTSSGAYTNGITRLEGWIPLRQQAGENITFTEPRFNVDNEGNLGGTVLIGHREYDSDSQRLWAGYLAWDIRETEKRTFNQLGLGLETLGDTWDVHLNGYIPLGDRNATIDELFFSSGGLSSSTAFEDNLLLLTESQSETRIFREDVSLGGVDLGTTVELADWNDENGDLRALATLYYLGGPGIKDDLGWRLGLELRPIQQIVMGIAVQDDQIFGTNVLASITVSLPRVRPKDNVLPDYESDFEVVERLGEPIRRNPAIVVATNTETETTVSEVQEPLYNPQNGTDANPGAYRFIHVSLGANQNGDGTFENPYNNIDDAIADARANSGTQFGNPETAENQIIYVDASNSININTFEIPAGVRVLSQGPTQLINGSNNSFSTFPVIPGRLPFSAENNFNTGRPGEESGIVVTLPGSGDGDFPLVNAGAANLITMNSNTVLSGFRIENASRNAILANGAENVEIRDSFINAAGERGIYLNDVEGSVYLFDNDIANINGGSDSGQGIFIRNTTNAVEVVAREQTIDDARVGIEVNVDNSNTSSGIASQIVNIETADITNSSEQGLLLTATGPGNNQQVQVNDTSIATSGAEGIRIEAQRVSSQEIRIEDSTVTNSGDAGIRVIGGTENAELTIAQEVFLFRNVIADNNGAGIDIAVNETSTQEFGIGDNIITGNTGDGIRAIANNVAFQEFVTDSDNDSEGISGNIITGNGGQGINIDVNDTATVLADIRDNTLDNTDGNAEIEITSNSNTSDVCAYVFRNNATTLGSILLDNNSSTGPQGLFEVAGLNDSATLTSNTTSTGTLTFLPDITAFSEPEGSTSCFTESDN